VSRLLRGLSTVLIVAGALLVIDAALTLVWQEPVSAFITNREQGRLEDRLRELEHKRPSVLEQRALATLPDSRRRIAFLARALRRHAHDGDALGRIRIPKIGASYVVVDGTATGDLRKGPGFYEQTPLPGVPGTTAIAGHRTTYLAPFRHIDRLRQGDRVVVEMPYGRFTYVVEKRQIVDAQALWVINRVGHDRLVLTACHPLYSAARRIVVFARLGKVVALGAARGGDGRTLVEEPPAGSGVKGSGR
jgi:sortase A